MKKKLKILFKISTLSSMILLLLLLIWGHFVETGAGLPKIIMIPFLIMFVLVLVVTASMFVWEAVLSYKEKGIKSVLWFFATVLVTFIAFFAIDLFFLKRDISMTSMASSAFSVVIVSKATAFFNRT